MSPEPTTAPGDDAATGPAQDHPRDSREDPAREAHPRQDWGAQTTEIARDALREAAAAAVKRRRRRFPRLGRSD